MKSHAIKVSLCSRKHEIHAFLKRRRSYSAKCVRTQIPVAVKSYVYLLLIRGDRDNFSAPALVRWNEGLLSCEHAKRHTVSKIVASALI